VSPTDDQRLRQRLHEEFGALEISPPPVLRVTSRGQGLRTRRRALAIGGLVVLLVGGALSAHAIGGQKAARPTVTVSAPDPAATGGVFASGTANGKRWALAVRNVNADPGTQWCLPAVMFNGRYGDVLYPLTEGAQAYGNPAYLRHIPGFPGVGAIFTQVKPGVTKMGAVLPNGQPVTLHPVRVSGCGGQHFLLAGFAFANAKGVAKSLTTWSGGGVEGINFVPHAGLFGPAAPGVWANTDTNGADIATSWAAQPIGQGTVNGQGWHIRAALGLFGQCYIATLRGGPGGGHGRGSECVPVSAPPRTVALDPVPIPSAHTQLPGYAGLVNPRAATVIVSINNGTSRTIRPVNIAGRAYIAFAVPPRCRPYLVTLYDAAGRLFASTTRLPPAR
jgi:hypothetical protein